MSTTQAFYFVGLLVCLAPAVRGQPCGGVEQTYVIPVVPPLPISNTLPPAVHTFVVPASGAFCDVDVDVTLTHTWVGDLVISLTHLGTTVMLFNHQCGSEDNFNGTVWDDEAAGPIACVAGHVGSFRPFSPLSAFDGLDSAGPWTITVADTVGGDSGSLTGWSLHFTRSRCSADFNMSGAVDSQDFFDFLAAFFAGCP